MNFATYDAYEKALLGGKLLKSDNSNNLKHKKQIVTRRFGSAEDIDNNAAIENVRNIIALENGVPVKESSFVDNILKAVVPSAFKSPAVHKEELFALRYATQVFLDSGIPYETICEDYFNVNGLSHYRDTWIPKYKKLLIQRWKDGVDRPQLYNDPDEIQRLDNHIQIKLLMLDDCMHHLHNKLKSANFDGSEGVFLSEYKEKESGKFWTRFVGGTGATAVAATALGAKTGAVTSAITASAAASTGAAGTATAAFTGLATATISVLSAAFIGSIILGGIVTAASAYHLNDVIMRSMVGMSSIADEMVKRFYAQEYDVIFKGSIERKKIYKITDPPQVLNFASRNLEEGILFRYLPYVRWSNPVINSSNVLFHQVCTSLFTRQCQSDDNDKTNCVSMKIEALSLRISKNKNGQITVQKISALECEKQVKEAFDLRKNVRQVALVFAPPPIKKEEFQEFKKKIESGQCTKQQRLFEEFISDPLSTDLNKRATLAQMPRTEDGCFYSPTSTIVVTTISVQQTFSKLNALYAIGLMPSGDAQQDADMWREWSTLNPRVSYVKEIKALFDEQSKEYLNRRSVIESQMVTVMKINVPDVLEQSLVDQFGTGARNLKCTKGTIFKDTLDRNNHVLSKMVRQIKSELLQISDYATYLAERTGLGLIGLSAITLALYKWGPDIVDLYRKWSSSSALTETRTSRRISTLERDITRHPTPEKVAELAQLLRKVRVLDVTFDLVSSNPLPLLQWKQIIKTVLEIVGMETEGMESATMPVLTYTEPGRVKGTYTRIEFIVNNFSTTSANIIKTLESGLKHRNLLSGTAINVDYEPDVDKRAVTLHIPIELKQTKVKTKSKQKQRTKSRKR